MSQGNMPTGSSPDPAHSIICFDPDNPGKPCPICGGLGVYTPEVPIDDPRFSKFVRCENNPVETDFQHQDRLRRFSNLDAYAEKNFENFYLNNPALSDKESNSLENAHLVAQRYASNPEGWIIFQGSYGCGKTHLAAAVGNTCLMRGEAVLFVTVPDLLDHLRGAYSPNSEIGYDEMFDRLRQIKILILDDLGVENPSQWAQEKLFQLLNFRHSHKKATIITTNAQLDSVDPRLRSRLQDREIVSYLKIDAPDYRSYNEKEADPLAANLHHYKEMTFENFDVYNNLLPAERQNLERVMKAAQDYARNPEGWLLLMGTYGSGKTHLAAAIALYRQQIGDEVAFVTIPDLLDYLRTTFAPQSNVTFDGRFNRVRNAEILVLDDFSMESASSWAKEKLFQILDYRYVARKPTILTTSHEIGQIHDRVRSRLLDQRRCTGFSITAPAYSIRMKRSR